MTNLIKFRKSKNYPKIFKFKKIISEILINLSKVTNASARRYLIAKGRVSFFCLK